MVEARAITANASPVADADSRQDYTSVLGADESTQYNGRVWTDKSVSTGDMSYSGDAGSDSIAKGDSDFLIAYSALATSTSVTGEASVPMDVVFVVDFSGSMQGNNARDLVDALNESVESLMQANDQNRIAVVSYAENAQTILSLDHYSKRGNNDFFSLNQNGTQVTVNATRSNGDTISGRQYNVTGGTNIHMGVDTGMDILANESQTTATVGGKEVSRVPALILLSDGAPTYSGADTSWDGWWQSYVSWWDPSGTAGTGYAADSDWYDQGDAAYEKFAMKTIMNASYNKQRVNEHYGVSGTDYAMQVYTVGVGVDSLGSNTDRNTARLTLNPANYLNANNTISNAVRNQWNRYLNNQSASLNGYTFQHPESGDITSVAYNDGYIDVNGDTTIADAFDQIMSDIAVSIPKVPTQVSGGEDSSGNITYTDPLGEYMKFDGVRGMLYCGQRFKADALNEPTTSADGKTVTYTFSGTVDSSVYGEKDASLIKINVTTNDDGTQTVVVDVPAAAIPVRVNTIDLGGDDQSIVESNEVSNAFPLRVFYGVSLQDGIADANGNVVGNVSSDYIADNTDEQTGKVNFYANKYTEGGNGDAYATFTPAGDNPYYFLQEHTPIYVFQEAGWPWEQGQYVEADEINSGDTYYIPVTYYNGTDVVNTYEERTGASLQADMEWMSTGLSDGYYYLPAGSERFADASDFNAKKTANPTGTSESKRHLTMSNGVVTIALGNNGRLQLNSPATLNVTKQVEVSGGVAVPADQEFQFTITASTKASAAVQATVTTPGDPETTSTQQINFDGTGKGTFTLKAGQTISIPGMANTEYTVTETEPGNGFTLTGIEGGTADLENRSTSGTIATEDASATFTNTFAAKGTLVGADNLEVTKSLTGRDWTDEDSFRFTLAADMNDETTAAAVEAGYIVLPGNAGRIDVTNASGHKASFGDITFTNTGTFKFLVTETAGASDNGIDYDTTPRVVTVTVSPSETPGQLDVTVDSITTQDGGQSSLAFTNSYEPASVELSGEYALKAKKTIDGRDWIPSDEFTFTLTGNGANQTKTIADDTSGHTVTFDSITITDEMMGDKDEATFTYEIKETASANEFRDDTHTATVTVTVKDNGEGALVVDSIVYANTEAPSDDDEVNTDIAAFTNYYDGGTVTYGGGDALLGGNKTVEDPSGFYEIADGDFGFYMIAQNASNPLPPESNGVTHTTFGTNPERPAAYVTNSGSQVAVADGNDTAVYDFGEIEFTSANMSDATLSQDGTTRTKSFVYYIREIQAKNIAGMSYDGTVYSVTFAVTENLANGNMTVSPSAVRLTGDEGENPTVEMNALNFTNTVNTGELDAQLNLYKTLQGRPFDADDEFVFNVKVTSSDPEQAVADMPKPAEAGQGSGSVTVSDITTEANNSYSYTVTVKPGATPASPNTFTVNGGSFTYTHTGTYTFEVSEAKGTDSTIDYDATHHTIVVTIGQTEEGGQPVLTRSVTMDGKPVAEGTTTTVDFLNTYSAQPVTISGESGIRVQKSLDGRVWKTDDNFTFELKAVTPDAPMPDAGGESVSVHGTDGGTDAITATFGDIEFTKEDLGGQMSKTFEYQIDEVEPNPNPGTDGVTYDTHVATVKITIVDDGAGQLKVDGSIVYGNAGAPDPDDAANISIAAFTNTYRAGSTVLEGVTNLTVTKELSGRPWQLGDIFNFTLAIDKTDEGTKTAYEAGNIVLPSNADRISISYAEQMDATKAFGDITFKAAGTYKFVVTEQASTDSSIQNDADSDRVITVEVVDNNDGTLTAKVIANQSDSLTFKNTYVSTIDKPVSTSALFTKVLDGREWAEDDSFTFSITPDGDAPVPVDGEGNKVTEVTVGHDDVSDEKDASGNDYATFGFGSITFTQDMMGGQAEKVFTYTVKETSQSADGITVDDHECTVTITVKDDFKGTLTATVSAPNSTFTNHYDSTVDYSAAVGFQIVKTLNGRDIHTNDFRFSFVPTGENAQAAAALLGITVEGVQNIGTSEASANDQNTAVNTVPVKLGDNLTFTQEDEGTYTYLVNETKGGGTGYTNDDKPVTVTISVSDNDKGVLTVTTTAVKDGAKVSEVTVTSDDALAGQTVTLPFQNLYKATGTLNDPEGGASIAATKTLSGRDMVDREFKFQVLDKNGNEVATGENVGSKIVFTEIDYDMDKIAAAIGDGSAIELGDDTYQYEYTIHEVTEDFAENGLSVTTNDQKVTVTVKDTGSGTLDVSVSPDASSPVVFENIYETNEVELKVNGNKFISAGNGENPPSYADLKDVYTFTLSSETEGAPMPDDPTAKMDDEGNITFGPIKFTIDNVWPEGAESGTDAQNLGESKAGERRVKTFTYRVTESGGVDYVANDPDATTGKTFSITVTDDGQGHLTAVVDGEAPAFSFTNTYQVTTEGSDPTGEGQLTITKVLNGRDQVAGEFTFVLTDDEGEAVSSGTNNKDGVVTLSPVKFEKPGEYSYTLSEVLSTEDNGVSYDANKYTVVAKVTDNGTGTLDVEWFIIAADGTEIKSATFENDYDADPTSFSFTASKKLVDDQGLPQTLKDGQFTFELADSDGNVIQTKANDANGQITFDALEFDAAGTYEYTVREVAGTDDAISYDDTVYTVKITVTDDLKGNLSVTNVDYGEGITAIVFTNVYDEPYVPPTPDPDPDPSDPSKPDIDVDKKLDGRDIVAGEFSFKIAATGDNADYVTPKALTGTVDASGNVSFSGKGFAFDKTGEYEFTVSEVLPGDDDPETPGVQHNGVTYDETTYTITAKVTKGAGNKLVVSWDLGAAAAGVTFHNEYEPDETAKVTVNATKVLIGRDLAAGEFTFELVDAQGNVVGTATNNADGSVSFSPLEFTEAGTYTYTLREVTGGLANVTYDTTVHTVTITVVDNGDGTLTATVTYDSGLGAAPVFTNTYKVPDQPGKPEEPSEPERPDTPKIPDAGDHTNVALPAFLAVGGAALIACACLLRLRKSR